MTTAHSYEGFRPVGDTVLVRRVSPPGAPTGPILLPQSCTDKDERLSPWVVVFAVGAGVPDAAARGVVPGAVAVLGKKWGGFDVSLNGKPFSVVPSEQLVAILD